MTTIDFITRSRIQSRVESFVISNGDEEGFVSFESVLESIFNEFGESEEVKIAAKKQYDFMFEF